ncbi:YfiR/HmsC family protein [Teredinibacter sp. KSP-S5-2]|uniref:YfiR/HmsC family protein n=1 Tax=Teredinibacter sp. KSP-S5-2 TaxID=3034506 RepID=UPI002934FB0E|nr:YfiR/HmsC family protein [Teredinibacter sp. KSP-S5-2]WNO08400.1 YfiR/HmsC family protein [Teredinibacter sp. KSP-S5-2]
MMVRYSPISRSLVIAVIFFVIANLSPVSKTSAQEQQLSAHQITASYLYNFAKNVRWPNEERQESFKLALYQSNNAELHQALSYLEQNMTLRGKAISIHYIDTIKQISPMDMVYFGESTSVPLEKIYSLINNKPVLIVTRNIKKPQWVMINLLDKPEKRIAFEVNKSNIINQGLSPLPELILNGGSEIDVAKLFREGQASLVQLQQKLMKREQTLKVLSNSISQQEAQNKKLKQDLANLNQDLANLNTDIYEKNILLNNQKNEIEKNREENILLKKELDSQELKLLQIKKEIESQENKLEQLNKTIISQDTTIDEQNVTITELDEVVTSQEMVLSYFKITVTLGSLLVITILIAFFIKLKDNRKLAARSMELQMARDRLAIAKRKAEEAAKAKSGFLSLMSHELRTPLQAIIGYTDVVLEELKVNGDETHAEDLNRVITNSERLLKLINSVLDLAKVEAGKMSLDLTEVKLSSLINEAIQNVTPQLKDNNNEIKIEVEESKELPLIDPEKLLQVIINLISNANKFTDNGLITVTAKHSQEKISISVQDTGIGMNKGQLDKIFESFKQLDASSTRKFQGTGLGLSISQQFCRLMGGEISVTSEEGKGSEFTVTIPLPIPYSEEEPAPFTAYQAAKQLSDEELPQGPTILMIDDDPAYLDIMSRTMLRDGYRVITASNAEQGYKTAVQETPQLITLDLMLPDEHGWVLFEKLKKNPKLSGIPIIIISIIDDRKKQKTHQADEYLTKPIGREALKSAVKRLAPISA